MTNYLQRNCNWIDNILFSRNNGSQMIVNSIFYVLKEMYCQSRTVNSKKFFFKNEGMIGTFHANKNGKNLPLTDREQEELLKECIWKEEQMITGGKAKKQERMIRKGRWQIRRKM